MWWSPPRATWSFFGPSESSPNTVKAYARALALWWQYLDAFNLRWDAVTVENFGGFLTWLRTGDKPDVVSIERRPARFAESTIAARLRAVIACYDFHLLNGVDVGRDLHRITDRGGDGTNHCWSMSPAARDADKQSCASVNGGERHRRS